MDLSYSAFYSICLSILKVVCMMKKKLMLLSFIWRLKKHGHEDYNSYLYSEGFFNSPKLIKQLFNKGFNLEKVPKLFESNLNKNENNTNIMYSNINPYLAFLPLKLMFRMNSILKHYRIFFKSLMKINPIFLEKMIPLFFSSILHANNYILNSFFLKKNY